MKPSDGTVHHVTAAEAGLTLGSFLRPRLREPQEAAASWSRVQRLVRSRHVMIHGNICTDAARRLKAGEVVKVLHAAAAPPPRADDVRIVHLDREVVVVDKPSGITTTRHTEELGWPTRRRQVQPTLDEMVPAVIGRRQASRPGPGRRGTGPVRQPPVRAVHRIDRETSGLVVFARTVPAERILAEQFRAHTTHRRYLALCVGRVGAGTIQTNLVRDRGDGRRGSSGTDEGKRAVTHVRPVEHFGDAYTFVECRLETGRTHQIRIHLAEIGHPVCGERVYAPPRGTGAADASGAARVMLHAAELGFVHPASGLELSFTSPLPADMRRLRERLRNPPRGPRGSRPAGTRGGMNAAETPGGLIAGANDEHYDDGGDADADHDTDD
jgi:23S rRNA pseudouridine1911/1915/1917 synthase